MTYLKNKKRIGTKTPAGNREPNMTVTESSNNVITQDPY